MKERLRMRKKSVNDLAREWWAMGLRGLAALGACVVFVATPVPHADNLLRVFGGYLLADGIIMLMLTIAEVRHRKSWAKSSVNGLLGVVFGITNLLGSGSIALRANVVAIRTFLAGISGILTARQMRADLADHLLAWLMVAGGVGSILFSMLISLGPLLIDHLLDRFSWVAVLYTFCLGMLFLLISFWLLRLHRLPDLRSPGQSQRQKRARRHDRRKYASSSPFSVLPKIA
jgi:uncharacterized membrane protein HdeD (DUF308 family)